MDVTVDPVFQTLIIHGDQHEGAIYMNVVADHREGPGGKSAPSFRDLWGNLIAALRGTFTGGEDNVGDIGDDDTADGDSFAAATEVTAHRAVKVERVPDDVAQSQLRNLKSVLESFENTTPLGADVLSRRTIQQMSDEELDALERRLVSDLEGWTPDSELVGRLLTSLNAVLDDPEAVPRGWSNDLDELLISDQ